MKKHWYFITVYYCPICTSIRTYRERRYDSRPEAWEDRHKEIDSWDYCDAL